MVYYLKSIEEKFDILVNKGDTLTQNFKRENWLKGIEAQ